MSRKIWKRRGVRQISPAKEEELSLLSPPTRLCVFAALYSLSEGDTVCLSVCRYCEPAVEDNCGHARSRRPGRWSTTPGCRWRKLASAAGRSRATWPACWSGSAAVCWLSSTHWRHGRRHRSCERLHVHRWNADINLAACGRHTGGCADRYTRSAVQAQQCTADRRYIQTLLIYGRSRSMNSRTRKVPDQENRTWSDTSWLCAEPSRTRAWPKWWQCWRCSTHRLKCW